MCVILTCLTNSCGSGGCASVVSEEKGDEEQEAQEHH